MSAYKNILINGLLDFLYPPLCLSCKLRLEKGFNLFCSCCLEQIIHPVKEEHCPRCFSPYADPTHPTCESCRKTPSPFLKAKAVFITSETTNKLIAELHTFRGHAHIKGISALMAYHFLQSPLKIDAIVAPPRSPLAPLLFGKLPQELLANSIAKMLHLPYLSTNLSDKKVLLISDRLDADLFISGEKLAKHFPQAIYALALTIRV